MPRFLVERSFPDGFHISWLHWYVTADKAKTFCVLDPYFYAGSRS